MFFHLELWYNEDFYLDYLKIPKMVIFTTKVAFDIFMHALFIYILVFFIKKR